MPNSRTHARRRSLLLLALLLPGCITCAMWDGLDRTPGQRAAAFALTPVTVALDAALLAGYVCVDSCGDGRSCGHWRGRGGCR